MSEDDTEAESAQPQGSVFGNLPESRPGTRSPRRDRGKRGAAKPSAAKAKASTAKAKTKAKPKAAPPKPKPRAAPKRSPEPEPRRRPEPVADERGGLEEIAWAGVAAAAEAATLGVKLANRALEALRGSERS